MGTGSSSQHAADAPATFPREASLEEKLAFLLGYAVQAPSGHNTQPWLFDLHDDAIWLSADRSRDLPALDPGGRERIMSCGAALFYLCIAARHVGVEPVVERFPEPYSPDRPRPLARIELGAPVTPGRDTEQLFSAMGRRRTHREAFMNASVPDADRQSLAETARRDGVELTYVDGLYARRSLQDMVLRANTAMMSDPDVRLEMAEWTAGEEDAEGVPGKTRGWSAWQTAASSVLLHLPVIRLRPWAQEARTIITSPLIGILSTDGDTDRDWFRTGEALAHVLLLATSYGLAASFLNQPVKVPDIRGEVAALLPAEGMPQIILRMGVPSVTQPTSARRPPTVRDNRRERDAGPP